MGVVAIENRINKLHSLEAQIEALEAEANAIRSEIKAAMDEQGVDELHTKNFVVRWKEIITKRFDGKAFKSAMPELYQQFVKSSRSQRLTIN